MPKTDRGRAAAGPAGRAGRGKAAAEPVGDPLDFQRDSLGYALRRAQIRAYEMFYSMLSTLELSPARLTALSIVAMTPDISQAALAQRLGITGPSVLKMVDALESAGYIARAANADDRRRYALALTQAGRAKMERMRTAMQQYESELARELSVAERRQLLGLLARVAVKPPLD